jgi:hypothetical protein
MALKTNNTADGCMRAIRAGIRRFEGDHLWVNVCFHMYSPVDEQKQLCILGRQDVVVCGETTCSSGIWKAF